MANKKIVVNVDIQAQAEQLNKIINQSKQSLKTLSPQIDTNQMKILEKTLSDISTKTQNVSNNLATGISNPSGFQKANKEIQTLYREYSGFVNKIGKMGIDPKKFVPSTPEFKKALDQYNDIARQKGEKLGKDFGEGISKNVNQAMRDAVSRGDAKGVKNIAQTEQKRLTEENRSVISKTASIGKEFGTNAAGATAAIKAEQEKIRSMTKSQQYQYTKVEGHRNIGQLDNLLKTTEAYDSYKQQHKAIGQAGGQYQQQATQVQQLTQALNSLSQTMQKLASPMQTEVTNALNQVATSEGQVKTETDKMKGAVDQGANSLDTMSKKAGQMQQLKSYFTYMFSATSIVMRLGQVFRTTVNDIKELDSQLNQISIVTGKSMDELWSNFSKLNSTAQAYGVTTKDVVSVQKLYYQQGRSVSEVNELTGETLTFAKISGLEFGDATEYMTAALNAYNIAATDSNQVTDVYAKLASEAAVDARELAVAMSKVASLSSLSGSSFEDTSAYLTKIIETTREAPETAGTALKTVIARFTAVNKLTDDQKELLDSDYNFNNIEKALKTVGIATKDSAGQIRGFSEILNELGPKWESLTENQKHYIATQAAGARQQSRFIALLDDWGRTEELMGEASDSAGTGAEQLELALDSIETQINKLKASWQALTTGFGADLFSPILGAINALVSGINWISDHFGAFTPIIIAGLVLLVKAFYTHAKAMGAAFMAGYRSTYNAGQAKLKAEKEAKQAMEIADETKHGFNIGLARAKGERSGYAAGGGFINSNRTINKPLRVVSHSTGTPKPTKTPKTPKTGGAMGSIGGALGKVGAVVSAAMPYALAALAAGAAIVGIMKIMEAIDAKKEQTAAGNVKSANKTIEKTLEKQETLTTKYTRALELNRKGLAKTEEETNEYQELLKSINEIYPQIVKKTTDGLYELEQGAEEFYNTATQKNSETLRNQHKLQEDNAALAAGAGVFIGDEAAEYVDQIKSAASILSESSEDTIKMLSRSDVSIDPEDLSKLAEQGLTRESVSEALGFWIDMTTKEYQRTLDKYTQLAKETVDGIVAVDSFTGDQKKVVALLNAINGQIGSDIVGKLWKETKPEEVEKNQVKNYITDIENRSGVDIPKFIEENTDKFIDLEAKEIENKVMEVVDKAAKYFIFDEDDYGFQQGYSHFTYNELSTGAAGSILFEKGELTEEEAGILNSITSAITEDVSDLSGTQRMAAYGDILEDIFQNKNIDTKYYRQHITSSAEELSEQIQLFAFSSEDFQENVNSFAEKISLGKFGTNTKNEIESFMRQLEGTVKNDLLKDFVKNNLQMVEEETNKKQLQAQERLNLYLNSKDTLDTLGFGKLDLAQLENITTQIQTMYNNYGSTAANTFYEAFKDSLDLIHSNPYLMEKFTNVDFSDIESIANVKAELKTLYTEESDEYKKFVNVVNASTGAMERNFKNVEETIKSGITAIEKMQDAVKTLNNAFSGKLTLDEVLKLIQDNEGTINLEDFVATSEGFKLSEDNISKVVTRTKNLNYNTHVITAEEKASSAKGIALFLNEENIEYKIGDDENAPLKTFDSQKYVELSQKASWQRSAQENAELVAMNEALQKKGYSQHGLDMIELYESANASVLLANAASMIDWEYENKVADLNALIDKLQDIKSLLEKIDIHANIDGFIEDVESKIEDHDFILEFSTNWEDREQASLDKINDYGNLINASLTKSNSARVAANTYRGKLEENYGKYVSFDKDGNLIRNNEAIAKKIQELQAIDTTTEKGEKEYEQEKNKLEILFEQIDAYEEQNKIAKEQKKNAKDSLKLLDEYLDSLKEDVVDMEDAFRELFIKRDEDALESLKKRYESMKQMDEDYLDTVRDAIEEERQLRDRTKDEEDLAKMQRQLELLRMSGGSATEIQKLEKEIEEKTQDITYNKQDDYISEVEKSNEKKATNLDDEIAYQEQVLTAKKENLILYNQEVEELMNKDKETILKVWKELDSEFMTATDANKQLLEKSMGSMIDKGRSAKNTLANDSLPAIKAAFDKVKSAIGDDTKAMEAFSKEIGKATSGEEGSPIKGIEDLTQEYTDVKEKIDLAKGSQKTYNTVLDTQLETTKELNTQLGTYIEYISKIGNYKIDWNGINSTKVKNKDNNDKKNIVQIRSGDYVTETDISGTASGKSWYKSTDGLWYSTEMGDFNADTGQFTINEEFLGKGLTQSEFDFEKAKMVANKAANYDVNKNGWTDYIQNMKLRSNAITTDKIQLYRDSNLTEPAEKETVEHLGDPEEEVNVIGVSTTADGKKVVQLREQAWDGDYERWISWDIFQKYFYIISNGKGGYGRIGQVNAFATGGLVDYTGPAWVDGTKSKPEAFLSASDTSLIAGLRDVLRSNPKLAQLNSTPVQKAGDTYYEIHINVDELGEGYSVDDLMNELEERIVQSADKNTTIKILR